LFQGEIGEEKLWIFVIILVDSTHKKLQSEVGLGWNVYSTQAQAASS